MTLIDTGAAAHMCGVSEHAIRSWATRGHIKPAGTRGKYTLYNLDDVLEHARKRGYVAKLPKAEPHTAWCCIDYGQGRSCGRPAETDAPVPLCPSHLSAAYLYVRDRFEQGIQEAAAKRTPVNTSVVYFVRFGDLIKIGFTTSMTTRMAAIQPDEILLTLPGGRPHERALHEVFKEHRVRGEWFRACQEILDFIEEQKTAQASDTAA